MDLKNMPQNGTHNEIVEDMQLQVEDNIQDEACADQNQNWWQSVLYPDPPHVSDR